MGGLFLLGKHVTHIENKNLSSAQASRHNDNDDVDPQPRIIEGMVPEDGRWPFMVEIIVEDDANNTRYRWCSGALIHEEWVATSAHCIVDSEGKPTEIQPDEGYVIADITDDTDKKNRKTARIKEVHVHPDYSSSGNPNLVSFDIGLLKIETGNMKGVPVLALASRNYSKAHNQYVIGLGWGLREKVSQTSKLEGLLGEAVMRIISFQELRESFENVTFNNSLNILTFPPYICYGDSGGPLIKWNTDERQYELVGIASLLVFSSDRKLVYDPCTPGTVAIASTSIVGETDSSGRTVREYISDTVGSSSSRNTTYYNGVPVSELHCNVKDSGADISVKDYENLPYCYNSTGYFYRRGCADVCEDGQRLCRYSESFIGCVPN
jgi:hypothetical protein